jgi:hypothetical protein
MHIVSICSFEFDLLGTPTNCLKETLNRLGASLGDIISDAMRLLSAIHERVLRGDSIDADTAFGYARKWKAICQEIEISSSPANAAVLISCFMQVS